MTCMLGLLDERVLTESLNTARHSFHRPLTRLAGNFWLSKLGDLGLTLMLPLKAPPGLGEGR